MRRCDAAAAAAFVVVRFISLNKKNPKHHPHFPLKFLIYRCTAATVEMPTSRAFIKWDEFWE